MMKGRLSIRRPMHDIGKIGIPDSILFKLGASRGKSGRDEEPHALRAQILEGRRRNIEGVQDSCLEPSRALERPGYPHGLKRTRYPSTADRSIADVFDALASKRVYKEALDLDLALAEIRASRDVMFSSRIVDAFMKGIDEIVAVMKIPGYSAAGRTFIERERD